MFDAGFEYCLWYAATSSKEAAKEGYFGSLPIKRDFEQPSCLKICKTCSSGKPLVGWRSKTVIISSLQWNELLDFIFVATFQIDLAFARNAGR